ncbi:MAG: sigma-70 family RNA polymerase sigma factor [Phycisphaerales bacterium]|nr:sigma-70 family RNA polymerase sigma factor [Phycisphaerales bacterium]
MFGAAALTDRIVHAAIDGSQEDLDRVLKVIEPQVRLMVVARLTPTTAQFHAAEDVTQRVMVSLAMGVRRLDGRTVEGLKAFVSGIVSKKVADLLNDRDNRAVPAARSLDSTIHSLSDARPVWQLLSATGTSPPSAAERAEQTDRLMAELGHLKSEHRDIITFAFFDQLPMNEIADRIRLSRPAASMLLVRAVRALRCGMTDSSGVGEDSATPV